MLIRTLSSIQVYHNFIMHETCTALTLPAGDPSLMPDNATASGPWLFNIKQDPQERVNLVKTHTLQRQQARQRECPPRRAAPSQAEPTKAPPRPRHANTDTGIGPTTAGTHRDARSGVLPSCAVRS